MISVTALVQNSPDAAFSKHIGHSNVEVAGFIVFL